jgi:hypothetical protein
MTQAYELLEHFYDGVVAGVRGAGLRAALDMAAHGGMAASIAAKERVS